MAAWSWASSGKRAEADHGATRGARNGTSVTAGRPRQKYRPEQKEGWPKTSTGLYGSWCLLKAASQLAVSAASHTGCVRPQNQDAYGYSAEAQCFAVCDGMGGAAGGEVASRIAVETFLERLGPEPDPKSVPVPVGRRMEQAVAAANRILYTRAQREQALHGMGTTMVALVVQEQVSKQGRVRSKAGAVTGPESSAAGGTKAVGAGRNAASPGAIHTGSLAETCVPRCNESLTEANTGAAAEANTGAAAEANTGAAAEAKTGAAAETPTERHAWIAHVGDSRCYLLRGGALRLCTRDHSLVEEQVRLGQLTPAEAAASPMRHVITRAVGVRRRVAVEVQELTIKPGDLFLLCSDGLTRELNEGKIAELLTGLLVRLEEGTAKEADLSKALVQEALAAGGADNITCLTVHMA